MIVNYFMVILIVMLMTCANNDSSNSMNIVIGLCHDNRQIIDTFSESVESGRDGHESFELLSTDSDFPNDSSVHQNTLMLLHKVYLLNFFFSFC